LRRAYWHIDFLRELDGVSIVAMPNQNRFGGTEEQPPMATVTGRIGCSAPIMTDAFDYLKGLTTKTAKVTIPSPSMLYMRGGRNAVSSAIYPDPAEFWEDVALAYQRAIRFLADRGCTYLQLDDVSFAYLCDPKFREGCRRNGDDPDALAPHLCGRHQCGAARSSPGDDGHHAYLPRQLQELMGCGGRL
jgi:5-methyltetrahydropteroyltriglutamate--homocysteine methyltransferase